MKNGKVEAVMATLARHGIHINAMIAMDLLAAASTRDEAEFEVGDFVETYEGMGNISFGEIRAVRAKGYDVMMWDESKEEFTYLREDCRSVGRLTSKAEARDYYLAMKGLK